MNVVKSRSVAASIQVGDIFGKWTVVGRSQRQHHLECRCSCGEQRDIYAYNLAKGLSTGCLFCCVGGLRERFEGKVRKTSKCWLWTGTIRASGYGEIIFRNKKLGAHRLSYELHYGVNPGSLQVCHHCDNPRCVRPDHLFLGTALDNSRDMDSKGRRVRVGTCGQDHPNSRFTAKQVLAMRYRYKNGWTTGELARKYKTYPCSIWSIVTGRSWKNLKGRSVK
jgi:hypothetical protein